MQQGQDQNYNSYIQAQNNQAYIAATTMEIRLKTEPILAEYAMMLRGKDSRFYETPDGKIVEEVVWQGVRIVNDEGYQLTMQQFRLIVNPQVVQGNFQDYDQYADWLCRARKDLACNLMNNRKPFELQTRNYGTLMSGGMRIIEAFMSRCIDNLERTSYSQTFKSNETVVAGGQNRSIFGIPVGKR